MSPPSYQTAPPRNERAAQDRSCLRAGQTRGAAGRRFAQNVKGARDPFDPVTLAVTRGPRSVQEKAHAEHAADGDRRARAGGGGRRTGAGGDGLSLDGG